VSLYNQMECSVRLTKWKSFTAKPHGQSIKKQPNW